jgi:hypothetical protein
VTTVRAPPLVDGFYWIRLDDRPVVAERTSWTTVRDTDDRCVAWNLPGSEDSFSGDAKIEVVSGPLLPPSGSPETHTFGSDEERRIVYRALHDALDRLLGAYFASHPGSRLSNTTLAELTGWSFEQTE